MNHLIRRPFLGVLLALAAIVAGCASAVPVATPSIAPSPSPASVATPSIATPPTKPSPSPAASVAASACAVTARTSALPSDRLVDVKASSGASSDVLTFVFGNPSLPGPQSPPKASVGMAVPPYTAAGSGEAIHVDGDHVLQMVLTGMSLANDAGQETYAGPRDIKQTFPGLRHAVVYDMSEGTIGWYIGYDGSGCVTLSQSGNEVRLSIEHP